MVVFPDHGPVTAQEAGKPSKGKADVLEEDGSILLVVMWWLVILSIMALALFAAVRPRLMLAGRLSENAELHYLGRAALAAAMTAVAADETSGFDALNDNWAASVEAFRDIEVGEKKVSVGYLQAGEASFGGATPGPELRYGLTDEESRININRASADVLQRLFELAADLSSLEAAPLAAAVIDWRDADDQPGENGAENSYYHGLSPAYSCGNRRFQVSEELLLVKGMTAAAYAGVEPYITLWGAGAVNLNTATPMVLQCIGLDAGLAAALWSYRAGPDGRSGTGDDRAFETTRAVKEAVERQGLWGGDAGALQEALNSHRITVRSDNFRAHILRELDNRAPAVHITIVFSRNGVVRLWRER